MKVRRREGDNTFCGPAALSALTGRTVDSCVKEVHAARGYDGFLSGYRRRPVKGMHNWEMTRALARLGFHARPMLVCGKPTIAGFMRWLKKQPYWSPEKRYLINVTGHYVVMRGIKLFDNHNPEGVFFGKYGHRRVRVKHAWEVARTKQPL